MVLALCIANEAMGGETRPNIVLIVADDLGYGDLSGFHSRALPTPNIDSLAAQGTRFTSFYATPVCTPFRAGLLTGSHAIRIGLNRALFPGQPSGLAAAEETLPELLNEAGYRTMLAGKWHLGDAPQHHPTRHGFESFFGIPYSHDMWPFHPQMCRSSRREPNRLREARSRAIVSGARLGVSCYSMEQLPDLPLYRDQDIVEFNPDPALLTRRFLDAGLAFIAEPDPRPFFLMIALTAPHVPLAPSPLFAGRSGAGRYADTLLETDAAVGELVRVLEARGLGRNTLVAFTSDNGPWLDYGSDGGHPGPFSGGKGSVREGGIRVPLVVRWPGDRQHPSRIDAPLTHLDLMPTLLELAEARPPLHDLDGLSMASLSTGQLRALAETRPLLFFRPGGEPGDVTGRLGAIRQGRWKLHLRAQLGLLIPTALYDLDSDPAEATDLKLGEWGVTARLLGMARSERDRLAAGLRLPASSPPGSGNLQVEMRPDDVSRLVIDRMGAATWAVWDTSGQKFGYGSSAGPRLTMRVLGDEAQVAKGPRIATPRYGGPVPGLDARPVRGWSTDAEGSGFAIEVDAGKSNGILHLWIGGEMGNGRLEARLSDGSAPPYSAVIGDSKGEYGRWVVVHFRTASEGGAQLSVRWRRQEGGPVSLRAAALMRAGQP